MNYRNAGQETAGEIMRAVTELPLEVIDTISPLAGRTAAHLKANYSMSLAGCFFCATARSFSATIVTKDGEIRVAEQPESLPVLWIT